MKAVDDLQIKILTELMALEVLNDYFLVGGTNLALRENHRKSVDLDLFAKKDFDINYSNFINFKLKEHFGVRYINTTVSEVGVFGVIDGVKVDVVNFSYDFIKPIELLNGWRLVSKIDIAAMKINAVTGRGSKKDFYDIAKLLECFSIKEMLDSYQTMYKIDNVVSAVKSLGYFTDAENETYINNKVVSLEKKSWEHIKNDIKFGLSKLNRNKGLSF